MTRKKPSAGKPRSKNLRLKKETLKDLDAKRGSVKGGALVGKVGGATAYTCLCGGEPRGTASAQVTCGCGGAGTTEIGSW